MAKFVLVSFISLSLSSCSLSQAEQTNLRQVEQRKLINNGPDVKGFAVDSVYFLSVRDWGFGSRSWHMDNAVDKFNTASQELSQEGFILEPLSIRKDASIGKTGGDYVWITATFIKSKPLNISSSK